MKQKRTLCGWILLSVWLGVVLLGWAGCRQGESKPTGASGAKDDFWVASVRLDRAFTKAAPDAVESADSPLLQVVVQLRDQFGDPLKQLGRFRFELFKYRAAHSDVRGPRLEIGGTQLVDLSQVQLNQDHWDGMMRAYRVELPLPVVSDASGRLVLQVTFLAERGYRLEDQMVLEPLG